VDHAVRADESLFPGLWAEEAVLDQEEHRLGQQEVELLGGNLKMLFLVDEDGFSVGGILTKDSEPVTETTFGGEDTVLEAEVVGILGVLGFAKVAQGPSARPVVGDLPASYQEDRDGIEGYPTSGGSPAQELGQDGAQGGEVHQAQDQIEGGEVLPDSGILEVLPAQIDIVRAIGLLGGRGYV
jgi:hypothetical protein